MSAWHDKVVLVTGGSSGLGLVAAKRLAQLGANVVAVARDSERLAASQQKLQSQGARITVLSADVTQRAEVTSLFSRVAEEHHRLDMLVHCVGQSDRGLALETPPERYRELWETNFLSAVYCSQAAMPLLVKSRGHLVFIGSLAAKSAARYLGAYPTSKFPLAAFAQQLRLEVQESGVHVLLVCPGPLQREDAGARYDHLTQNLPDSAKEPGGGVRVDRIDPVELTDAILRACERRQAELIVPGKARWLFAISQLWPSLGDWIIRRKTQ